MNNIYSYRPTFYIEKDLDSDALIMKCIDSMLINHCYKHTFYVHNLGRHDSTFLLKVIIGACFNYPDKYKIDIVNRNEVILSIRISNTTQMKVITIKKFSIAIKHQFFVIGPRPEPF